MNIFATLKEQKQE